MDSGNNSTSPVEQLGGTLRSPGRVALLMPYWDFWETSVPWDLRADRDQLLAAASGIAATICEVAFASLVPDVDVALSLRDELRMVDAVIVVSTMAAPSATTTTALDGSPDMPILVWALSRSDHVDEDFSHTDITTAGSSVGAPMVASALTRAGHRFDVVASSLSATEDVRKAMKRLVAAGICLRRPVVAVGDPIPGYTTVVAPEGARGVHRQVSLPAMTLAEATAKVIGSDVEHTVEQIRAQFDVDESVSDASLTMAARTEMALRDIVRSTGAVAGTINCHDSALRGDPTFGFAPCLALGRLTTEGVPFTCTGDVLTAVAMLVVRSLGHPTLYHEIEALDFERSEVIIANSGEHDLGLCSSVAALVPNNWYLHDPIVGPCARFSLPPGPASLVAFVMTPEPRFVVAEGEFTGRHFPATGVPNGSFRFNSAPLAHAWSEWVKAGVTHHSVATTGHLANDIRGVARLTGAQFVHV